MMNVCVKCGYGKLMWQIVNPHTQGVRSQKRRSQIYNEISLGENQAEKKQAYS